MSQTGAGEGAGAGSKAAEEEYSGADTYAPYSGWSKDFSEHDVACLEWFRKYLCERTVSILDNYEGAIKLITQRGKAMGLKVEVMHMTTPKAPLVILTWAGEDPSLPGLLLNSHMDVVPVEKACWKVDPWAAVVEDGLIYGRGTQDMKSVGAQYLDAVERMKANGFVPKRNVYLLFVPDEEMSGIKGMQKFVHTDKMREMNVGLCLDEGLASPDDNFVVFYGERKIWWIKVKTTGNVGHGSRFIQSTAVEKLMKVANHVLEYRREQEAKLVGSHDCGKVLALGDVCTMNLTMLKAGSDLGGYNVVPGEAQAGFDCRIPVTQDLEEFKAMLNTWTEGEGVEWELICGTDVGSDTHAVTPLDGFDWWSVFEASTQKLGMKVKREVFPAATDSRYVRLAGIPALGFSPMVNTKVLMHDHNEYVPADVYVKGIDIYVTLLGDLINTVKPGEGAKSSE